MLFGKKQSLVGLDIGSHTIKAVELEPQANRSWRLTRWGISAPLAEANCFLSLFQQSPHWRTVASGGEG